jgi:hypothetical protein
MPAEIHQQIQHRSFLTGFGPVVLAQKNIFYNKIKRLIQR